MDLYFCISLKDNRTMLTSKRHRKKRTKKEKNKDQCQSRPRKDSLKISIKN